MKELVGEGQRICMAGPIPMVFFPSTFNHKHATEVSAPYKIFEIRGSVDARWIMRYLDF